MYADCFRWEIRSQSDQKIIQDSAPSGPAIPARQLSLTANGIKDPYGGLLDIRARSFRFFRNLSYRQSPLFLGGRHLEVFAALLYLQTLFEAGLTPEELTEQPGRSDARSVFFDATEDDTRSLLRAHPY